MYVFSRTRTKMTSSHTQQRDSLFALVDPCSLFVVVPFRISPNQSKFPRRFFANRARAFLISALNSAPLDPFRYSFWIVFG